MQLQAKEHQDCRQAPRLEEARILPQGLQRENGLACTLILASCHQNCEKINFSTLCKKIKKILQLKVHQFLNITDV